MKYLLLLAILGVVYLLWRARRRPAARPEENAGAKPAPPPTTASQPQDMVRCPVCAVHLPRGDAVADAQGRLFCSPEHSRSARH